MKKPLRERIHPEAVALYDEVVTHYYPDTLVQPAREGLGWFAAWQQRHEDEHKFKHFMGVLATDRGATTERARFWGGWPEVVAVEASQSPELRTAAWQRIRDTGERRVQLSRSERFFYRPRERR